MSLINKSIEITEDILEENRKSNFTFSNLSSGTALTIGNFLRRNLLSLTSGISVLGVRISNNDNELISSKFSLLKGISVTVPYLILNIKEIVFKQKKEIEVGEKFSVNLKVENNTDQEISVKAGDFQESDMVEIQNPEILLANLQPSSSLSLELYLKKGIGYKREDQQREDLNFKEESMIPLDSDYSPVKEVNIKIEELIKNFSEKKENLILTISTNGGTTPKASLEEILDFSKNTFEDIKGKLKG